MVDRVTELDLKPQIKVFFQLAELILEPREYIVLFITEDAM
jgi:hypothetical protein